MEIKKVLLCGGLLVTGYKVGKVVGYVKCVKGAINCAEDAFPGCKKYVAKKLADAVIDEVFKNNSKEEEES